MKVQRVCVGEHQYIWLVLDDDFLPIKPIEVFIRYLHHIEKSPDTIQSYAAHLKLFWEYFHHVFKHRPVWKRIVGLKVPKTLPKVLTHTQISQLIDNCSNPRDKFLISLLCETGMRIGQTLALRHTDIKSWDNEIQVIFRQNNANQARNKSRTPNVLHVSQELMQLYTDYLQSYPSQVNQSDYVFINFQTNEPLCYNAVRKLFSRLMKKVGFHVTPHMFRHSHATELIRHGWDAAWVQKRLGHANVQTTIDTYTHIDTQDLKQAFKLYQANKRKV